jgi:hypothetical protein
MKYRKKPVTVTAWEIPIDTSKLNEFINEMQSIGCPISINLPMRAVDIVTLEGIMLGIPGDYIIMGIKGEFYPCKPDIFEATYERVDE